MKQKNIAYIKIMKLHTNAVSRMQNISTLLANYFLDQLTSGPLSSDKYPLGN